MTIVERTLFPALKKTLADRRVVVITGMRRVGKTTTLRWLLEQVPSRNKIYLDLERLDQRAVFQQANYDLVINYLRSLGLDETRPLTVALDEIQYTENLPSVIKYLYDHYGIKFLLTGSSSFYLKNFFSESLAGRKVIYELHPLSFGEFLDFRGIPYRKRTSLEDMRFEVLEYGRLSGYYEEYIKYGGFPDVVLEPSALVKHEILLDIISSYINIDVRVMADIRRIGEFQQLLKLLALRTGSKLDLTKLSKIIGISRPTLNEYLEFLEMTFVIHRLPAYAGVDKATALGKKLYFRDNGLASVLANPGEGALFENAVFNQLAAYGNLSYLMKSNAYEVDFILQSAGQGDTALEVKYHPLPSDLEKISQISRRNNIAAYWLVGCKPTPGFENFLWGGSIF